ncbi:hypothetical protein ACWIFN_34865, partial [Streptomyces adustus]
MIRRRLVAVGQPVPSTAGRDAAGRVGAAGPYGGTAGTAPSPRVPASPSGRRTREAPPAHSGG